METVIFVLCLDRTRTCIFTFADEGINKIYISVANERYLRHFVEIILKIKNLNLWNLFGLLQKHQL
jgi:hypothetical protein